MPLPRRKPRAPSEGVFFIVRLPDHWQLCTFRFDEFGPAGIPDFWIETLGPFLNLWLQHFETTEPDTVEKHQEKLQKGLGMLVANYDVFPRGVVTKGMRKGHFVVRHGGDISRTMHILHRDVEAAFGIAGHARWVIDETHASSPEAAQYLRKYLPIPEEWERREEESEVAK
jgi:hypothetical protein